MLTSIDARLILVGLWIRVKSVVINRVVYRLTSMYASRRVGRKWPAGNIVGESLRVPAPLAAKIMKALIF